MGEDITLGDPKTATMPWAIKFKITAGFINNVTFRRIRVGKVGDTPWMYPTRGQSAFLIDFADASKTKPKIWAQGITFEDISVVSEKVPSHISGPGSCVFGLTVRNVTLGGSK